MIARLLWKLFPARTRDDLRAELDLEYAQHVRPALGSFRSRVWYARQFTGSLLWARLHHSRAPRPRTFSMESLFADLRFAFRSLRRAPGLAGLAALTIALGVGTSSVVFAVTWKPMLTRRSPKKRTAHIRMSTGSASRISRHWFQRIPHPKPPGLP